MMQAGRAGWKMPPRRPSHISMKTGARLWTISPGIQVSRPASSAATVCFYGTGIHDGKLGLDRDAGSLARVGEIRGKLLMVFGAHDPHVPAEGRETIDRKLRESGVDYSIQLYPAEHAFMRDEGPRYDPEATDQAFAAMMAFFREVFR